jgi:hypothetical protein
MSEREDMTWARFWTGLWVWVSEGRGVWRTLAWGAAAAAVTLAVIKAGLLIPIALWALASFR